MHLGLNMMDDHSYSGARPTDHISMCYLLAFQELFETVGLLDEDFFFGNEDWAYSCMARKQGLRFGVNLDSIIYHKFGESHSRVHPIYGY
ncbi:MAG: glycosyltransferase family 2 protein [Candidatus Jordarchaeum sp.]|uniref:glycosyltransferase family 2 protein n=1 Tax=Candidatus Jordarchaeum sp. TaxID=2823881 RepID=UPI00404A45D7